MVVIGFLIDFARAKLVLFQIEWLIIVRRICKTKLMETCSTILQGLCSLFLVGLQLFYFNQIEITCSSIRYNNDSEYGISQIDYFKMWKLFVFEVVRFLILCIQFRLHAVVRYVWRLNTM